MGHHGRTLFFQLCGLLFLCCSDKLPSCGAVSIGDSDAPARCRASVTASLPKVWEASLACDDFPLGTQPANISVVCPISVWCQSDVQFETYAMSSISRMVSALWIPVSQERHNAPSQAATLSRAVGSSRQRFFGSMSSLSSSKHLQTGIGDNLVRGPAKSASAEDGDK